MDPLPILVTRLSRLNSVALEERAGEVGITSSEAVVLSVLARGEGPLNPSRLQGLVIQSPGGLTKTLRRLERAGYIKRLHDPADRRALLVALTPKGGRAARLIDSVITRHYDEVLGDLDAPERGQLRDLLRKVLDRLEPQMGMPSSRAVDRPQ